MSSALFPLLGLSRHRMGTDGVGITTLAAAAGCPLHCRWCINRDLLSKAKVVDVTPEEFLERVRIDDLYFRATGGGITFGGGEPLLQADFIKEFREICPEEWMLQADFIKEFREICPEEWKITVETSLFVPRNYLAQVIDAVDLFVVDCKDMNEDIYRKYTGEDSSVMEENLQFLLQRKDAESILVRVPLIPGYNTAEDQKKSAEKLREMGVKRLDLFEYRTKVKG